MANIENAIVSQLMATRRCGKSVTFDASSYGPSDKKARSASRDNGSPRKAKSATKTPYDYPACRHRRLHYRADFHYRAERRLAKSHKGQDWTASKP